MVKLSFPLYFVFMSEAITDYFHPTFLFMAEEALLFREHFFNYLKMTGKIPEFKKKHLFALNCPDNASEQTSKRKVDQAMVKVKTGNRQIPILFLAFKQNRGGYWLSLFFVTGSGSFYMIKKPF